MKATLTTRISQRRALLCVVLAVSLCAPRLPAQIAAEARKPLVQILAVAGTAQTILVHRSGARFDDARQRSIVDSPGILINTQGLVSGRGQYMVAVEAARPTSRCDARTRSGRSPPTPIS